MNKSDDFNPGRRMLLAGMATSGALLLPGAGAMAVDPRTRRPFDIGDYLRRQDILQMTANRDGSVMALQLHRGLDESGFYADSDSLLRPRCDIWVAKPDLDAPRKVTQGFEWYAAPLFSPDGKTLAMIRVGADGAVHVALLREGAQWAEPVFSDLPIEIAVTLASWGEGRRSPMAWVDSDSLLVVKKFGPYRPRSLSPLMQPEWRLAATARSRSGELSVRTWNTSDRTTCSPDNVLVRVDTKTGAQRELFTGDIRAVSVSPDRKLAAILYAKARIAHVPRDRMPGILWPTGEGFEETRVELGLSVIELDSGRLLDTEGDFIATGQSSSDVPLWADDSLRFGIAARTAYSSVPQDSAAYLGAVGPWGVRLERIPAASPLDAMAIACLVAASSSSSQAQERIARKPAYPAQDEMLDRHKGGQVLRSGAVAVVASPTRLDILRALPEPSVSLDGTLVGDLTLAADGALLGVVSIRGKRFRARISERQHALEPLMPLPAGVSLTMLRPSDGRQVCVQHTDDDTRTLVEQSGGRLLPGRFRLNRHFAEVRRPAVKQVDYPGHDGAGRQGMVYLPTDQRRASDGLPVVVFAYPDSVPSPERSMGRPNSASAWLVQPFLAAGYAVFHAAFPVQDTTKANAPFGLVSQAVMPALDALDALPEAARGRYGFYGQSNGGYAGLVLGAQTDRFRAIIVSAAFPDTFDVTMAVSSELSLLDCAPSVVQSRRFYLEAPHVPYSYATSVVEGPGEFLENSALYNLRKYSTPTMLVYGEHDVSLPAVEKMFLGLQIAGVDAELLTLWGEGHVLQNPKNIRHVVDRQIAWLNKYL